MLTILNTSILTATLDEAKALVANGFESAIGHQSTADVISTLLGVACPMNRIMYQQGQGDVALVFKLNGRPEEGKILSVEDIEEIGYSWGVLERTA